MRGHRANAASALLVLALVAQGFHLRQGFGGLAAAFAEAVSPALLAQTQSSGNPAPAPPKPAGASAPAPSQPATATAPTATSPQPAGAAAPAPAAVTPPPDYVIGPDDILTVTVWREKDLSSDAVVRTDGRITLPLVNDVVAEGLTPDALRARIAEAMSKYVEDPNVTVVVKQINSRKVFVTGQVGKPGPYPLADDMTVLQLLSIAGGVAEFSNSKNIMILRKDNGVEKAIKFNYKDVIRGKNLQQNILLKAGDTIVVP